MGLKRHLVACSLALLATAQSHSASAGQSFASCAYRYSLENWNVNEHTVPVEIYEPSPAGTYPLVFMLHGSAGAFSVGLAEEPRRDNFGEKTLAQACFVVVFPHYLEGIGRKSLTSPVEMKADFPRLMDVTGTLLDRAEEIPSVRLEPVFIFGDSLGGYLGIALTLSRSEVAAVSEISGGKPEGYGLERRGKPSVLISHGADDTLVPPSEAKALEHYCSEHGIPAIRDLYPGEGHYLSQRMEKQILTRTIEIFRSCGRKH